MSSTHTQPKLEDRPHDQRAFGLSARRLAIMAVFIALSAVGALIKIPSPVGTVALDAAPGFFVAIGFGGWMGAVVAAVGHLLTAGVTGFPLTLPLHLAIAAGMAACAWVFGWLGRKGTAGLVAGFVLAVIINSPVLALIMLPVGGWPLYLATLPSLAIGAVLNLAIATVAYLSLRKTPLLS